jgi:hypothetical protein
LLAEYYIENINFRELSPNYVFENRVLRRISGPKRDAGMVKSRRMRWAGNAERIWRK